MRLNFKNYSTGQQITLDSVHRQWTVEKTRELVYEKLGLNSTEVNLRFIYAGKELKGDASSTLFHYRIGENDTILINISKKITENASLSSEPTEQPPPKGNEWNPSVQMVRLNDFPAQSEYYKTGDKVDVQCAYTGAWFEAVMEKITTNKPEPGENEKQDIFFHCRFEREKTIEIIDNIERLAPRAHEKIHFDNVIVGDKLLVNYNVDFPKELGDWFRSEVKEKHAEGRRAKNLVCDIFLGSVRTDLKNCKIVKIDELYKYDETTLLENRKDKNQEIYYKLRTTRLCTSCNDNPAKKCRSCRCVVCKLGSDGDRLMLCEECNEAYHIFCLNPALDSVPDDDWYCPECKTDDSAVIKAGEQIRLTKRRLNMPSQKPGAKKLWDSGNQCKGLTKRCTKVGADFFGPIPGVEVGTTWQYQTQLAEAGVHRMVVAGIHGSEKKGAFSIVVSGGYEDDKDEGDQIYYTGSGGRDLSGNKRTSTQSFDQKFERSNLGLARNCAAKLNPEGGDAKEKWRDGKPVRVCRSFKGKTAFSPKCGYRYDGIYKVAKYWKEKGQGGHCVYRYLLKRDDPTPAPWTKEGQKRIKNLGLEKVVMKDAAESDDESKNNGPPAKKSKYKVEKNVEGFIKADKANEQTWKECLEKCVGGQKVFVDFVEEAFSCIICCSLMVTPVTTDCGHSFCQVCLKQAFNVNGLICPTCRNELSSSDVKKINKNLHKALLAIFPGYNPAAAQDE